MMRKLRCRDWIDTEKAIWIVSQDYNALLQAEKNTNKARLETFIENKLLHESGWSSGILCQDSIVCIPSEAKDIAIYSLKDKSMFHIPVKEPDRSCKVAYNPAFKFFRGYAYENQVLLFGANAPALMHIDLKTKKASALCDWVIETEAHIPPGYDRFYFGDGHVRLKKELFIPMNCFGAFLAVELETLKSRLVFPPEKLDGIEGVTQIEDKLCFIGRKGNAYDLCIWHLEEGEVKKLRIPYQGTSIAWISFLRPLFWKSRVYLVPQTADHFYTADLESGEIWMEKNLDRLIAGFPAGLQDVKVGEWKQNGNLVVFHTWWDYKWHQYNLDTGEHVEFELQWRDEDWRRYQKEICRRLIEENSTVSEKAIPLPVFLDVVKDMERSHREQKDDSGRGEQRWKIFLKTGR